MKNLNTIIHLYRFNIENEEEKIQYLALCEKLKSQGLKVFDGISMDGGKWLKNLSELNGQAIELETEHLFNNQWNTAPTNDSKTGLRVFDWSEEIYPNKRIKEGQYLEQTPEMKNIREETYKCNYCGKQYHKPEQSFCNACIGSEYLTEDNLPLLFLTPVNVDKKSFKGVNLPDGFIDTWKDAHIKTMAEKLKKQQAQKLLNIQNDIAASKKELKAFTILVSNNIDFENVIYYKHSDTFSFGWRNTIPKDKAAEIKQTLDSIGFTKKFKTEFKTC